MNQITKETRKESFEKIKLKGKTKLIYKELNEEMTARELAKKLFKKRFNKNIRKTRNCTKINGVSRIRVSRNDKKEIR